MQKRTLQYKITATNSDQFGESAKVENDNTLVIYEKSGLKSSTILPIQERDFRWSVFKEDFSKPGIHTVTVIEEIDLPDKIQYTSNREESAFTSALALMNNFDSNSIQDEENRNGKYLIEYFLNKLLGLQYIRPEWYDECALLHLIYDKYDI